MQASPGIHSTHMKARTMNRNQRLVTIAFLASALGYSGGAHADDITIDPSPFVSSTSRTEVRAELDAFKKSGINPWATHYDLLRNFKSSKTRAQVTAEYISERDAVASMNGEDSGSNYLAGLRHAERAPVYLATGHTDGAQQ